MKTTKTLFCAILSILFLGSCSFEKRLYNKGYHIDWLSKKENTTTPVKTHASAPIQTEVVSVKQIKSKSPSEELAPITAAEKPGDVSNDQTIIWASAEPGIQITSQPVSTSIQNVQNYSGATTSKVSAADLISKNKKFVKRLLRNDSDNQILLIILCLLLPPLAMYMYEGNRWTSRCTLNLILTLLCGLPGVIHALLVILGNK